METLFHNCTRDTSTCSVKVNGHSCRQRYFWSREFPGGPVVRTRRFHCPVGELRTRKMRSSAKKKKKIFLIQME